MRSQRRCILSALTWLFLPLLSLTAAPEEDEPKDAPSLLRAGVRELVNRQEAPGQWAFCGDEVERPYGGIAVGHRVGGTAVVAEALLFAAPNDKDAQAAVRRSVAYLIKQLHHPRIAMSNKDEYDARIWGQIYALEFLCHARARKAAGGCDKEVDGWISRLAETLIEEEIPDGGWNYGGRRHWASVVTAPAAQALLLARSQGAKIPDEVFQRARKVLESARREDGAFAYPSGNDRERPESAGRSVLCETTLVLLGGGSIEAVRSAVDKFFEHWEALEAQRRAADWIHGGPYGISSYYFYFGHRYAAQAIRLLPDKNERVKARQRLLERILQTRDPDNTWNDMPYARDRYYGTGMVLLALLGDQTPLPPKLTAP